MKKRSASVSLGAWQKRCRRQAKRIEELEANAVHVAKAHHDKEVGLSETVTVKAGTYHLPRSRRGACVDGPVHDYNAFMLKSYMVCRKCGDTFEPKP